MKHLQRAWLSGCHVVHYISESGSLCDERDSTSYLELRLLRCRILAPQDVTSWAVTALANSALLSSTIARENSRPARAEPGHERPESPEATVRNQPEALRA